MRLTEWVTNGLSHNDVHIRLWTNPQRTC